MDDESLIGYCELHCQSERALFKGVDINRMLALAGHPAGFAQSVPADQFMSVHEPMEELCRLARTRLKVARSQAQACEGADMTNVVLFPLGA